MSPWGAHWAESGKGASKGRANGNSTKGGRSDYRRSSREGGYSQHNDAYYSEAHSGTYSRSDGDWSNEPPARGANSARKFDDEDSVGWDKTVAEIERSCEQALLKLTDSQNEIRTKQDEKFTLMYDILEELQARQGRMEQSINNLLAAANPGAGGVPNQAINGSACGGMQACPVNYTYAGCGGGGGNCANGGGGIWMSQGGFQFPVQHYNSGGCCNNFASGQPVNFTNARNGMVMQQQSAQPQPSVPQQQQNIAAQQQQHQPLQASQQQAAPLQQPLQQQQSSTEESAEDLGTPPAGTGGSTKGWQARRAPASPPETDAIEGGVCVPSSPHRGDEAWTKTRFWKVTNLNPDLSYELPLMSRPEAYAPGSGRNPPQDLVVVWLKNGDIVKQTGHSKKLRNHMVMPVFKLRQGELNGGSGEGEEATDSVQEEGWVVRRYAGVTWFEEVLGDTSSLPRQRSRDRS